MWLFLGAGIGDARGQCEAIKMAVCAGLAKVVLARDAGCFRSLDNAAEEVLPR